MTDADDIALLRKFAREHSEAAFTELVRRHVHLVYSVAWRCTGNNSDAQDVTQAVFIILVRKAAGLHEKTVLAGWLYETTRFTAARLRRANARRHAREQEAYMQSNLNEAEAAGIWEQLAPHLEAAMSTLAERDRALLVLRFYQNKTGPETAALLGLRENTLHKRVARALEKLRMIFAKQGVTLSGESIAGAISANSIQAAPAGMVNAISAVALAKGAAASASTLTLVKGALKIMAWTKTQTTVAAGIGILLVAGTTSITVREIQKHERYPWQVPKVNLGMIRKFPPQAVIVPTIFDQPGMSADYTKGGGAIGICQTVTNIVRVADPEDLYRLIFAPSLPVARYDYFARVGNTDWGPGWRKALQVQLKSKLGIIEKTEVRNADVLLLEYKNPNASGLLPARSLIRSLGLSPRMREMMGTNSISFFVSPVSSLQETLQGLLEIPVIDRSGLTGNYDFKLIYDPGRAKYKESLKQALYDQLGFELVPTNMPYEMLVVEKAE